MEQRREKRRTGCLGCLGAVAVCAFGIFAACTAFFGDDAVGDKIIGALDRVSDASYDSFVYANLKTFARHQSRGVYTFVKQHQFKVQAGTVYYHKYLDGGAAKECAAIDAHGTIIFCPDESLDDLANLIAAGCKRDDFQKFAKRYGGGK